MKLLFFFLSVLLVCEADAGTVSRPSKSFGGTAFINGVIPQASDFNGDADTLYSEFNGNIDNANIKAGAAIDGSKIIPNFSSNQSVASSDPCFFLNETDQSADARRWYSCVAGGNFSLTTRTDAGVTQNTWLSINRTNGGIIAGGSGGTNTISGNTTFNQNVTITGTFNQVPTGTMLAYGGSVAPSGFNLCDGTALNRTTDANLFAVTGTIYGAGDGSTTFNVPNAKARNFLFAGAETGLTTRSIGQTGGTETHQLTAAQSGLPEHTHNQTNNATSTGGNIPTNGTSTLNTGAQATTGVNGGAQSASQAHPILDPFLVVTCIIKK